MPRTADGDPETARPVVFALAREEIRRPYIEIIETSGHNRLITTLEVLSPDNKRPGAGRRNYLKKRSEVRRARANFVEIDLMRMGRTTLQIDSSELEKLRPWHYLAGVMRWPNRQEVYAITLQQPLPTIGIPLGKKDPDAPLDLQTAFALTWQKGPYPDLLDYDRAPPGEMSQKETAWCLQRLREVGMRS